MMDWENAMLKDFDIEIEGESIEEFGSHIVFPVRVYHKDGTFLFNQSVSVRSEFYRALKKTANWQDAMLQIIRQRVRDDLVQRFKKQTVSIDEKIDFLQIAKQSV